MAIFLMWLGVEANYNPELNLLNMHKQAAYTSMAIGIAMFATATLGWTAAATKSECLSFGVSKTEDGYTFASHQMLTCIFCAIVRLLGSSLLPCLHLARCDHLRRKVSSHGLAQRGLQAQERCHL